jgi:hypothetical protein
MVVTNVVTIKQCDNFLSLAQKMVIKSTCDHLMAIELTYDCLIVIKLGWNYTMF